MAFAQVIETVGVALLTVCVSAELVLAPNVAEPDVAPLYCAVMMCGLAAADSAEVVHVAVFPLSETFEHPEIASVPSLNVTLPTPFGFPSAAVTVAVNVTGCPYVLGFEPAVRATDVVVARVADATTTPFDKVNVALWLEPEPV